MRETSAPLKTMVIHPPREAPNGATFDYIIIGSGAGGGPLAARLALNGQRVLVIEAGSDTVDVGKDYPAETYDIPAYHAAATEDDRTSWSFSVRHYENIAEQEKDPKYDRSRDPSRMQPEGTGKGGIFYPRAAALGGCTSHHAMIMIRPNDSDWEDIANLTGDQSWRSEHMQGYFPKIEQCLYYSTYRGFFGRFFGWVQYLATKINPALHLDPNGHGHKGWQPTSFIDPLESVQESGYRASLLVMSLIIAVWMKARLVAEKRSKSFAIRRLIPSHARVRSTIHRFGST